MKLGAVIRQDFSRLIFVFISFTLMVAVSYFFVSGIVEKEIRSNVEETLQTAEAEIRSDLREGETLLLSVEFFIQRGLERGELAEEIRQYMIWQDKALDSGGNRISGFLSPFFYIDGVFNFGIDTEIPENFIPERRPWYNMAVEADGDIICTIPYVSVFSGETVITLAKVLRDKKGASRGIVGILIDFSLFSNYVVSLRSGQGGYGMLLDHKLDFIVHPNSNYINRSIEGISRFARIAREFRARDETYTSTRLLNSEGIPVVLVFRKLFNNWRLGIATPVANYYQDVYSMALALSVLGLAFMIILSVILIRLTILKTRSDEENKDKSSFLARMSHEIRTPMNSILGMAELIQRKQISSEVQEYVSILNQAGNTLLAIINDILDFSRIESGRLQIEKRHYHLSSVINDMVNVIRPRAAEKSLDFFVTVDSAIPARLYGDDVRLRQILINLLSNAVKYTKKGFISLQVGMERVDSRNIRLICTVEDSGIGIKAEDMTRLFAEFARVDAKVNQGIEGTGLGLVITQALCQAMGGDITVSSEYEVGSIFEAWIVQDHEDEMPVARVFNTDEKRVLFYDWRSQYVASIMEAFDSLGITPVCPSSFPEFLLELEQGDYNYAFISSRYAMDSVTALGKRDILPHLVVMVELGEVSVIREISSIMMPVYSVTLANVFNDAFEGMSSQASSKLRIRFTAPEARILIVDDISTNLRVARELMAPYNMITHTCLSGPEAIELVKRGHYDIVFMDHMMPGMDGIEATSFIRALDTGDGRFRNLPIVALTANAVAGQREMFLEHGINDFLAKPIDVQKLDDILEKWISPEKQVEAFWTGEDAPMGMADPVSIPGVNTEAGLRNIGGSEAAYLDILSDFCRDAESRAPALMDSLEAGDLDLYVTLVHALKGAARSIGALETGEAAAWLERAAKSEGGDLVRRKNAELLEGLGILVKDIRAAAALRKAADGRVQGDVSTLNLETLKTALAEMNIEAVNKLLLEYATLPLDEETRTLISDVEEHILLFEYEEAIEKINRIL